MAQDVFLLRVAFDDGPEIEVGVKQRDILRLEELDRDMEIDGDGIDMKLSYMPALAWLALQRMSRRGNFPEGVVLPESFDEFRDICDVEGDGASADPSVPAPSTGS